MQTQSAKAKENMPGEILAIVLWWVALCILVVSLLSSLLAFLKDSYPALFGEPYYVLGAFAFPVRLMQYFMQPLLLSLSLFICAVMIKLLGRLIIAVENIAGKMQKPGA